MTLEVYDEVEKVGGYKFPGYIVAKFQTMSGETRYVVECTAPDVKGILHIYNEAQLKRKEGGAEVPRV